jgi:hypothetical protein
VRGTRQFNHFGCDALVDSCFAIACKSADASWKAGRPAPRAQSSADLHTFIKMIRGALKEAERIEESWISRSKKIPRRRINRRGNAFRASQPRASGELMRARTQQFSHDDYLVRRGIQLSVLPIVTWRRTGDSRSLIRTNLVRLYAYSEETLAVLLMLRFDK